MILLMPQIRTGASFCDGQAFQLASAICREVYCMTLVRRVTRPIQKAEMPKLYTGLYMYKKINQYYMYKLLQQILYGMLPQKMMGWKLLPYSSRFETFLLRPQYPPPLYNQHSKIRRRRKRRRKERRRRNQIEVVQECYLIVQGHILYTARSCIASSRNRLTAAYKDKGQNFRRSEDRGLADLQNRRKKKR